MNTEMELFVHVYDCSVVEHNCLFPVSGDSGPVYDSIQYIQLVYTSIVYHHHNHLKKGVGTMYRELA